MKTKTDKKRDPLSAARKILGVTPGATKDEIKQAFHAKAKELHPDVNQSPEATRKMQELNAAYATLLGEMTKNRHEAAGEDADAGDAGDGETTGDEVGDGVFTDPRLLDLFRCRETGEAYATIDFRGSVISTPLNKEVYRDFIATAVKEQSGAYPKKAEVKEIIWKQEVFARTGKADRDPESPDFGKEVATVWSVVPRVGEATVWAGTKVSQRFYIDMCDGNAIEISRDGWTVISRPPCKFHWDDSMDTLPYPVHGGDVSLLRPFVNVSDDDFKLLLACLVAAYRPNKQFPIILVTGEYNSGKSSLTRIFKRLTDPVKGEISSGSRGSYDCERNLLIAAKRSWVVTIDNQSHLSTDEQDAYCKLATGIDYSTRKLRTDTDEQRFSAMRPIILNSITGGIGERGDFRSRVVHLHTREIKNRQSDSRLREEFEKVAPQILGGLMDAAACAMKNVASIPRLDYRMADFAQWACAAAPALGFTQDEFLSALDANLESNTDYALEASPIYLPLYEVAKQGFRGQTSELLAALRVHAGSDNEFPRTAKMLHDMLQRLIPDLRKVGIVVNYLRKDSRKRVSILEVKREKGHEKTEAAAAGVSE